jgi:hypothetical protein
VRITPKHDGGLLGAGELAWDSIHGVPLRLAVYAAGDPNPVLELKASNISYAAVDPSVFTISPPTGAKVVSVSAPGGAASPDKLVGNARNKLSKAARQAERKTAHLTGAAAVKAVQGLVHFTLAAPDKLVGLPRHTVQVVHFGKHTGALVTYGQNLGGILVFEQPAAGASNPLAGAGANVSASVGGDGERHRGLSLPTVSINGVTGNELDTALGTMVQFTRGNVSYTVLGSVPAAAADAAARAL